MGTNKREPRVPDDILTSLFLASLEDDANDQVMQVRPITIRRMITEIRHHRAIGEREEFLCDVRYTTVTP